MRHHQKKISKNVKHTQVVKLRGSNAHSAGVQGAVAPAEHPETLGGGVDGNEISVVPNSLKLGEVGLLVLAVVCVIPEEHWLAGEGPSANQVSLGSNQGLSFLIPALDAHSESTALDLSPHHRQGGAMASKERNNVSSPGDGAEEDIALDFPVDIVVALWLQGRTSGIDALEGGEVALLSGLDSSLLQGGNVLGTGSKGGDPKLIDQAPEGQWVRLEWRAIKEDDGGSDREN